MARLRSVKEWLWRLEEIRNNLHVILPTDEVRCLLAVWPEDTELETPRPRADVDPGRLRSVATQGLGGLLFLADGDLHVGGANAGVAIHQSLSCPKQPGLSLRALDNVGLAIVELWKICPRSVLRCIPWAQYTTGSDGILLYAYLFGMHPLLTAREWSIESEEDPFWDQVSGKVPIVIPPCFVLEFEHDWRSIIGFTLDAVRHSVEGRTPPRFRGRRKQDTRPDRGGQWSKPMTKANMMTALRLDSRKKFETYAKKHGIRMAGNRQTWQLRLEGLVDDEKQRLRDI